MESHVAAGHPNSGAGTDNGGGHFVSTETVSRVGFGDRTVPDVHLTRFAAYFVALNADQSKPESTARDTPSECEVRHVAGDGVCTRVRSHPHYAPHS